MTTANLSSKALRWRETGHTLLFSLLETASLFPFAVLIAVFALKFSPLLLWAALWIWHTAGVLTGTVQARGGPIRSRMITPVLFVSALLPLLLLGIQLAGLLTVLALWAITGRGLLAGRKQWMKEGSLRLPLIGLGAALVMYISAGSAASLQPYQTQLYVMAMLTLFMLLLRWNGEKVRDASRAEVADRQLFGRILSANRSMTWIVILLIALLCGWKGLGSLFLLMKEGLRYLLGFLQSEDKPQEPAAAPPEQQMPQFTGVEDGTGHPPLWLQIAGYVFLGLIGLLVAVLLLSLLYRLFRRWLPERIRKIVRNLAYRLGLLRSIRRVSEEPSDFVDEVEKIEKVPSAARRFSHFRKQREVDIAGSSDPRQTYANLIRGAMRKGYRFRPSQTPAENGNSLSAGAVWTNLSPEDVEAVIRRYNEARYGSGRRGE